MMNIQVSIDAQAKDVITSKGNVLAISRLNIENCCVPIAEVVVNYKKPEHVKMFHQILIENITLYIDKSLDFKKNIIHIKHTGFGKFRTVRVEGVARF